MCVTFVTFVKCVCVAFVAVAGRRYTYTVCTSSEYDETTWSARTWMTFVAQRISVALQLSSAQEVAEALGLSVAADPRAQ